MILAILLLAATDINLKTLFANPDGIELKIFSLARLPRLLAILCTGVGVSVAGLACATYLLVNSHPEKPKLFSCVPALVFLPAIGLMIAMVIVQDTDYVLLHEQWLKDHAVHHKK